VRGEHAGGGESEPVETGTTGDEGDFVSEKHLHFSERM
jgi:hypothetical protein